MNRYILSDFHNLYNPLDDTKRLDQIMKKFHVRDALPKNEEKKYMQYIQKRIIKMTKQMDFNKIEDYLSH